MPKIGYLEWYREGGRVVEHSALMREVPSSIPDRCGTFISLTFIALGKQFKAVS